MTQEVLLSPSLVLKQSPLAIEDLYLLDLVVGASQESPHPTHRGNLFEGAALMWMAGTAAAQCS